MSLSQASLPGSCSRRKAVSFGKSPVTVEPVLSGQRGRGKGKMLSVSTLVQQRQETVLSGSRLHDYPDIIGYPQRSAKGAWPASGAVPPDRTRWRPAGPGRSQARADFQTGGAASGSDRTHDHSRFGESRKPGRTGELLKPLPQCHSEMISQGLSRYRSSVLSSRSSVEARNVL